MHEVRAGLAELREVGDDGLVRLDDVTTATAAERSSACVLLGRARHRQVGADAGERVESRALRLVEPFREARDRDHEADADGKAEQRHDRAATAAHELCAEIAEVEHGRIEPRRLKTELRLSGATLERWLLASQLPRSPESTVPALADWIAAYERAWASNDPDDIRALFTRGRALLHGAVSPALERPAGDRRRLDRPSGRARRLDVRVAAAPRHPRAGDRHRHDDLPRSVAGVQQPLGASPR